MSTTPEYFLVEVRGAHQSTVYTADPLSMHPAIACTGCDFHFGELVTSRETHDTEGGGANEEVVFVVRDQRFTVRRSKLQVRALRGVCVWGMRWLVHVGPCVGIPGSDQRPACVVSTRGDNRISTMCGWWCWVS